MYIFLTYQKNNNYKLEGLQDDCTAEYQKTYNTKCAKVKGINQKIKQKNLIYHNKYSKNGNLISEDVSYNRSY